MKNAILVLFLALSVSACYSQTTPKTSAQEVTPDLVMQRELLKKDVISQYLELKNNFIVSDSLNASKSAANFATAMGKFKFKKLSLEEMNAAMATRKKVIGLANTIAENHNINKQRNAMMELSAAMWDITSLLVPEKTVLYEQKCPMTGKVWISAEKEIKNPYTPKNMLTCGAVNATVGLVE